MDFTPAPTLCLSMIVRDEAHIIKRCLDSVKPFINRWVICDTGSVDDTCVLARTALADLPGRVVHHPWQDFGHNRTLALQEATKEGCDYILVIDADEVLQVDDPLVFTTLVQDAYRVEMRFPTISYPRVNIMRSARDWRYVGVIHEYATCSPPAEEYLLDPEKIHMWTDGAGARGKSGTKVERDVAVMEQSVIDEPNNPRYWFYLAQGYETTKQLDKAIETYAKRATMGDYIEEVWFSHYRMAQLCTLKGEWSAAILHYLDAYACQPNRAEPLYWLAIGYHNRQMDRMAMLFLEQVVLLDKPVSALFVEPAVYDYLRWIHYTVCLYNLGEREEAALMARKTIEAGKAPKQYLAALERMASGEFMPAVSPTPVGV
jgi:glycosyltransferase involved in cell wall biosynthesis